MHLLSNERRSQLAQVLQSKYFTGYVKKIYPLLRKSRDPSFYNDPINSMALQITLAKLIGDLENVVKEGKKKVKELENSGSPEMLEGYQDGVAKNRELVRVIRTICDGLAWRTLQFDRSFIRIMADVKKPFGSVELTSPGYKKTEEVACTIIEKRGSLVLLNDITNFLTLGDLTEVGEKTIIFELKKNGQKLDSVYHLARKNDKSKPSKQLSNIIPAQIARDYREILLPNGKKVSIRESSVQYQHYLNEVQALITKAKRNTVATAQFSDYLWVQCTDQEKMVNRAIKEKRNVWEDYDIRHPFQKKDKAIPFSNHDTFFYDDGGDFFRTIVPYTVYPLKDYDVMHLVSGKLFLQAVLNLSAIERTIRSRGWDVKWVDIDKQIQRVESQVNKPYSGKVFERTIETNIFTISRRPYFMNIPQAWIMRISSEFTKLDTILDFLEETYSKSQFGVSQYFDSAFMGESDVWQ